MRTLEPAMQRSNAGAAMGRQPVAQPRAPAGKIPPMGQRPGQAVQRPPRDLPPMAARAAAGPSNPQAAVAKENQSSSQLPPLARGKFAAAAQRPPWAHDDGAEMFPNRSAAQRQPMNAPTRLPQPPAKHGAAPAQGAPFGTNNDVPRGAIRPQRGGNTSSNIFGTSNNTNNNVAVAPVNPAAREKEAAIESQILSEKRRQLQAEVQAAEKAVSNQELRQCRNCSRKFLPERLGKHESACAVASKPRKVFNMKQQRQTDEAIKAERSAVRAKPQGKAGRGARGAAAAAPQQVQSTAGKANANNMPKWKAQSLQFRAAMRSARAPAGSAPQGPVVPDNRVECRHCKRKFAHDVAERHIPKCAKTINRPNAPKSRR